jgi:hypothetical protein
MKRLILLTLAAAGLLAADATGTWTGTLSPITADGDAASGPAYMVLKQEGTKLTGTVGPTVEERHAMNEGKAENGTLTFEVPRGTGMMKFTLKQEGDTLTGDLRLEREGKVRKAKIDLKRQ